MAERTEIDPIASLREPGYLLFLAGSMVTNTGNQMRSVAVGWEVYHRTHEAISLGFTAAVIISSAWLTAVAINLYRRTRTADAGRRALARPVPQPAMEMKVRRQG